MMFVRIGLIEVITTKKYIMLLCVLFVFMPFVTHAKVAQWNLGLNLADTTFAFFENDGIHIPVSMVVEYEFTKNFRIYSSQIIRFPMRGGYVYTPTVGLRVHSNRIYRFTGFLGTDIGYKITNVPWFNNGVIMNTYLGSRHIFSFRIYVEGGIGGEFHFSTNAMSPSFFLVIGYPL